MITLSLNPLQRMATPFTSHRVTTSLTSSLRATTSLNLYTCSATSPLKNVRLLHRPSLLHSLPLRQTLTPIFHQSQRLRLWNPMNDWKNGSPALSNATNSSTSQNRAIWKTMLMLSNSIESNISIIRHLPSPAPKTSMFIKTSTSVTKTWQLFKHVSPISLDQLTQQCMQFLRP